GLLPRRLRTRTERLQPKPPGKPAAWLPLVPENEKLLRGAVLCRAGRHAEAVRLLEPLPGPIACLFRALAEQGGGNVEADGDAGGESVPALAVSDFDRQGLPDLAAVESTGSVDMLLNTSPREQLQMTVSPASTTAGVAQSVTVSALDFAGNP